MNSNQISNIISNLMQNNMAMQNPIVANAMKMYRNNDTNGLRNLAENLCKEKGINLEDMKQRLMNER